MPYVSQVLGTVTALRRGSDPNLGSRPKVGPGCIRVPRRFRGTVDYAVRAPEAATVQQIGRDTAGGYGRRRLL
jgi:hypothetical protein